MLINLVILAFGALIGAIYASIVAHNKARAIVELWQKKLRALEAEAKTPEEVLCIASAQDVLFKIYTEI